MTAIDITAGPIEAEAQGAQPLDGDVAGVRFGHAHGQIGIAPVQVHRLHACDQLHPQIGMNGKQPGQGGNNERIGQIVCGGEAHASCHLPLLLPGFAKGMPGMFQRFGPRQQGIPIIGQPIAVLMTTEQRQTQCRLQAIQPSRDSGNAHVKGEGGATQGAAAGDGQKDPSVIP